MEINGFSEDVYFIPKLKSNLVSLGQLTEFGYKIVMDGSELEVFVKDPLRLLMRVQRSPNRLYRIELKPAVPVCLLGRLEDPAWLWHGRLGHVNFRTLKMVGEKEMAGGVPAISNPDELCHACFVGKQTRIQFPKFTNFRAEELLGLVYVALCGPITPATPAGNKYFILFVDDHTRWMYVFMLKPKDQATSALSKFKADAENFTGQKNQSTPFRSWGGVFICCICKHL